MFAGKFQIRELLGRGPFGWTYHAVERGRDVEVVLKVLDPRYVHLPNEKKLLAGWMEKARRLVHPNIARVLAAAEDAQGMPYVVSEAVDGVSLRRVMELRRGKAQPFSLAEVGPIVAQIARALEASRELPHGDLKPDNVLVLADHLVLTDFGLAPALPRGPFLAAQKHAGVEQYLPPELFDGAPADRRSDVFSLGVLVAELLSGASAPAPFVVEAMQLPSVLERVCRRATSLRPEHRFASAAELSAQLFGAFASGPVEDDGCEVEIVESVTDPRMRIARALETVTA